MAPRRARRDFRQVVQGTVSFEVCLTTEKMLPSLKPIARVLKQKMPTANKGVPFAATMRPVHADRRHDSGRRRGARQRRQICIRHELQVGRKRQYPRRVRQGAARLLCWSRRHRRGRWPFPMRSCAKTSRRTWLPSRRTRWSAKVRPGSPCTPRPYRGAGKFIEYLAIRSTQGGKHPIILDEGLAPS